ncbi:hypothetical protein [Candidatus Sororendozoicomonas aggregata]|uniref:hypothetical protein n=1 Tax=Candidatus Sororendozoicomonas aggregata TaxID=3073239 RepID=UPI002ED4124F
MAFTHIAFYDMSRFECPKLNRTFTIKRLDPPTMGVCGGARMLELRFYEGRECAGYAKVFGRPADPVAKKESKFTLQAFSIFRDFQFLNLDSLLIYIVNTEVRLNGGEYLYVNNPLCENLGFFVQLGFIPDPKIVRIKTISRELTEPPEPDAPLDLRKDCLNQRLSLSRQYTDWKCLTALLNVALCEKMCEKFKLADPPRIGRNL